MLICSAMLLLPFRWTWCSGLHTCPQQQLNVDDTSTTFAGVMNGRYKVYVDPYAANVAASQYYVVGYKGTSPPYDAGFFYCPYVPLQMVRAVGENTFQPKIGFKTRYVANPFAVAGAEAANTANDCAHSECECLLSSGQGYKPYVRIRNLTTNLGGAFGHPLFVILLLQ